MRENFLFEANGWKVYTSYKFASGSKQRLFAENVEGIQHLDYAKTLSGIQEVAVELVKKGVLANGKDATDFTKSLREFEDGFDAACSVWQCLHCSVIVKRVGVPVLCLCGRKDYRLVRASASSPLDETSKAIEGWSDFTQMASMFAKQQPVYYDGGKKWWMWNKKEFRWQLVDETQIMVAVENGLAHASFTTKNGTKNEILEALRRRGRRDEPKPAPGYWVQFQDDVFDIKKGETFKATPEFFVTNPIPWKLGESEDTPMIDRLFREWVHKPGVQDESWANTLHEIAAYSMLNIQPLQKLFAFVGAGANGKGTYTKLLQHLLGGDNYAVSEMRLLCNGHFESSALYRKLAVFMSEASEDDLTNTNLLKSLSGEDKIRYEFKGKDVFKEESYATCFLSTNSLPLTSDKSVGYYRRWIIVDFPNTFAVGADPIDLISDEEMGNWCRKLLRIVQELLVRKTFTNEGDVEAKRKRYEQRSNPIGHYIEECYSESIDDFVEFRDFAKGLNKWLRENNHRSLTPKSVSKLLKECGYPPERKSVRVPNGRIVGVGNYEREDTDVVQKTVVYGLKLNVLRVDEAEPEGLPGKLVKLSEGSSV